MKFDELAKSKDVVLTGEGNQTASFGGGKTKAPNFDELAKSVTAPEPEPEIQEPGETQPTLSDRISGRSAFDYPTLQPVEPGELWDAVKATPEVADELITGAMSFFPAIGAKIGRTAWGAATSEDPEKTIENAEELSAAVSKWVDRILHFGMDTSGAPSEEALPSIQLAQEGFELPREYIFEPIGKLYEKVTGSKLGGAITTDGLELLTFVAIGPKMKKIARRHMAKRAREKWKGQHVPKVEEQLSYGKTREGYYESMTVEELFGPEAARKTREALESRDRTEAAQAIRERELAAQQRVYDKLFTEENVKEYLDDVEAFAERKARGEGGQVTRADIEWLYDGFVERMKQRDLEFRKDWENWQKEKLVLESQGIRPALDPLDRMQMEVGIEGKGLPPGTSDLRFGVEAQRPYPREARSEPTIEVVEKPRPQREKLGYKKDYSLRQKESFQKPKKQKGDPLAEGKVEPITETADAPTKVEQQGEALATLGEQISGLVGESPESVAVRPGQFPEAPRLPTSRTEAIAKAEKLKSREELMKRIAREKGVYKAEVERTRELEQLKEEQRREMEAEAETPEQRSARADLRAAQDMDEFLYEHKWEPEPDSLFFESLEMDRPRPLDEMVRDWKEFLGEDFRSERGSFSWKELNEAQKAQAKRLMKDIQVIKRNAGRVGKSITDYLEQSGFADRTIAEAIEKNADRVLREERQTIEVSRSGNPQAVNKMFKRARREKLNQSTKTLKDRIHKAARGLVARDEAVRRVLENDPVPEAERALHAKINAAGSYPRAAHYFETTRRKIYGHLSADEHRALDKIIHAKTEIEIGQRRPNYKHPDGLSTSDYVAWLKNAKENLGLSDEGMRRVAQASQDYFDTYRDLLNTKFKEGAIPEWLYEMLKDNSYSPSRWLHIVDLYDYGMEMGKIDLSMGRKPPASLEDLRALVDPKNEISSTNMGPSESGLRRLKGGMEGYKELDSQSLMAASVAETWSWVMRNQASRSLAEYAKTKGFDGDVVRTAKIKKVKTDKHGNKIPIYQKPPQGWKEIHYFERGSRQTIWARDWFADQWKNSSGEIRKNYSGIVRMASGSAITREMATGAGNPLFFLKGLPMDLMHVYASANKRAPDGSYKSLYSIHAPWYMGQITKDLGTVGKDAILRKGRYIDFLEEGGHFNFLTETGAASGGAPKARGKLTHGFQTLRDVLGYLNKTAEVAVRLGIRERAIREGYEPWQATAVARDYLDYTQGGSLTKILDDALPYLNAGIQAGRGMLRSAKRAPGEFAVKSAWISAFAGTLHAINTLREPEAIQNESSYNRNNYFLIPTGQTLEDSQGNKFHLNVKIRKDPSSAAISALTEVMMSRALGQEDEFKRALVGLKDAVPYLSGLPIPPYLEGVVSYVTNTDMLTLEKVWHGEPAGEGEWYASRTSQLWKDLGEAIDASPERLKAAFEAVGTSGNLFAKLTGETYDMVFKELPDGAKNGIAADLILDHWTSDFFSIARETSRFREDFEDISVKEQAVRVAQNQKLDLLAERYYLGGEGEFTDVAEFIGQQSQDDQKRLKKRLKNFVTTMNMKNHDMWMMIGGQATPEAKAKAVVEWWRRSDEEKQREIQTDLMRLKNSGSGIVPKEVTGQFWKEFYKQLYSSEEKE